MLILALVYTIVNGYNNKIFLLSVFWMHVFVYAAVLPACKPSNVTVIVPLEPIALMGPVVPMEPIRYHGFYRY